MSWLAPRLWLSVFVCGLNFCTLSASVQMNKSTGRETPNAESSRDCVSEEVSGALSVPNKPSGFCGRKAVFTTTTPNWEGGSRWGTVQQVPKNWLSLPSRTLLFSSISALPSGRRVPVKGVSHQCSSKDTDYGRSHTQIHTHTHTYIHPPTPPPHTHTHTHTHTENTVSAENVRTWASLYRVSLTHVSIEQKKSVF